MKVEEKGPKGIGTPEPKSKANYLSLLGHRSHVISTPILEVNYEASVDDSKILDSELEMNGSNFGFVRFLYKIILKHQCYISGQRSFSKR